MKEILTIEDYKPYTLKELTKILIDIRYLLDCHPELNSGNSGVYISYFNHIEENLNKKLVFNIGIKEEALKLMITDESVSYLFGSYQYDINETIYFKNNKEDQVKYFKMATEDLIETLNASSKYMFNKKLDELKITYQNE